MSHHLCRPGLEQVEDEEDASYESRDHPYGQLERPDEHLGDAVREDEKPRTGQHRRRQQVPMVRSREPPGKVGDDESDKGDDAGNRDAHSCDEGCGEEQQPLCLLRIQPQVVRGFIAQ